MVGVEFKDRVCIGKIQVGIMCVNMESIYETSIYVVMTALTNVHNISWDEN